LGEKKKKKPLKKTLKKNPNELDSNPQLETPARRFFENSNNRQTLVFIAGSFMKPAGS
jgi:hypothetical protein